MMRIRHVQIWMGLLLLFSCSPKLDTPTATIPPPPQVPTPPPLPAKAKNVIFLIGDGMGTTQITTAMIKAQRRLNIEKFKHIGFHKNKAADDLVTDSAAGATAFSTGKKTKNGYVGVDANKTPSKTIMELAMDNGLATGLVATSTITHATPAAFAAHWHNRRESEVIAGQMAESGVDIMIGGGKKDFDRRESDERNLIKEMQQKGYTCQSFFDTEIVDIQFSPEKKYFYLTADGSPIPFSQGRDYFRMATSKTIDYLSKRGKDGFFVVIEGSQIDWGGHSNEIDYVISELLEFDDAIGIALDFARKDGETLVLVTADHETGGLTVLKGSTENDLKVNFSSDYHTAEMIPVFAYGPGAENFNGIYENTEIFNKLKRVLAL